MAYASPPWRCGGQGYGPFPSDSEELPDSEDEIMLRNQSGGETTVWKGVVAFRCYRYGVGGLQFVCDPDAVTVPEANESGDDMDVDDDDPMALAPEEIPEDLPFHVLPRRERLEVRGAGRFSHVNPLCVLGQESEPLRPDDLSGHDDAAPGQRVSVCVNIATLVLPNARAGTDD